MVKALPKSLRKQLVPVPDYVDRALANLEPSDAPLAEALAGELKRQSGVSIDSGDWPGPELDDFYRMNVRVVDADGKLLRQGRDLAALVDASREESRDSLAAVEEAEPLPRGMTRWELDELPERRRTRQAGIDIHSYPALTDDGDSVSVTLHDYPQDAAAAHRRGLVRLFRLQCAQQVRYLRKNLLRGNGPSLLLAAAGLEREALLEDLVDAVFAHAMLDPLAELPRSESAFREALKAGRGELVNAGNDHERVLLNALEPLAECRSRLADLDDSNWAYARADIEAQLAGLVAPGFLYHTPWEWLGHYPRYMKALATRLERLAAQPGKDRDHTGTLAALTEPLTALLAEEPDALALCPPLLRYRWMLEELRVSFFAQSLGTSLPVSAKRLDEQWREVEAWRRDHPR